MTYNKPEIAVLGKAGLVIQGGTKNGPLVENQGTEPIPQGAYEVDE
jgi:hypothetical protein